ncbi:hypothetical protein B0I37DRAFT_351608 [Chaetomium sp. MPI-CAGE-AT-0009]|nr:hypothetical protein B0I37DRAFT_351608 [Chaetomium sp. MPI-CAGE-AT-0009]
MRMPHALLFFFAILAVYRGGIRKWDDVPPGDMPAEGAKIRGGSRRPQFRGQLTPPEPALVRVKSRSKRAASDIPRRWPKDVQESSRRWPDGRMEDVPLGPARISEVPNVCRTTRAGPHSTSRSQRGPPPGKTNFQAVPRAQRQRPTLPDAAGSGTDKAPSAAEVVGGRWGPCMRVEEGLRILRLECFALTHSPFEDERELDLAEWGAPGGGGRRSGSLYKTAGSDKMLQCEPF